jgi:hypothetical protein
MTNDRAEVLVVHRLQIKIDRIHSIDNIQLSIVIPYSFLIPRPKISKASSRVCLR